MSRNSQIAAKPHPGDLDDAARPVVTLASDHPGPHKIPPHRHLRAQLLYASTGVMTVSTAEGTWVVPPHQGVWVPPGVVHEVTSPGPMTMRSLYLHPSATAGLPTSCCVVTIPPLLRELILHAVTLSFGYPPQGPEARLMAVIPDQLRALRPEPLHLPMPAEGIPELYYGDRVEIRTFLREPSYYAVPGVLDVSGASPEHGES